MDRSYDLDRILKYAIAVLAVTLVAFTGYFGWTVYQDRISSQYSTPAWRVIRVLREQVRENPNNAVLRVRLGEAYASAGRDKDAIEQFNAALVIEPKHIGAFMSLGQLAMYNKRYVEAEGYFQQVLEITADDQMATGSDRREVALYQLGVIAMQEKRYEDAIGLFKSALRIRKDASDSYYFLALAFDGIGEADEAIRQLEVAVAFDPSFSQAHYYLGQLHTRAGDDVKAARHYALAIQADPEATEPREAVVRFGDPREMLEEAKGLAEKDPEKALEKASIAFYLLPGEAEAAAFRAELLEAAGDKATALDMYRTAARLAPEDEGFAAAVERLEKAIKKSKKAVEKSKK